MSARSALAPATACPAPGSATALRPVAAALVAPRTLSLSLSLSLSLTLPLSLALARETVRPDIAEGCLHRVWLCQLGLAISPFFRILGHGSVSVAPGTCIARIARRSL